MSKNAKLLISLTMAALLIVFYFIISSHTITYDDTGVKPQGEQADLNIEAKPPIDPVTLEKDYKEETKIILKKFEEVAVSDIGQPGNEETASDSATKSGTSTDPQALQVAELRERLMGVTVPEKFKDLHLDLVFAFNKMEEYFYDHLKSDREASLSLLSQAKSENDWLN